MFDLMEEGYSNIVFLKRNCTVTMDHCLRYLYILLNPKLKIIIYLATTFKIKNNTSR